MSLTRNNRGVKQLIGDSNKTLDSISPPNRQTDREGKPGARAVSKSLYQS